MINLLDFVIISMLVFGIWSSYTDIKFGKIKNHLVLLLFFCGFLINTFITKTFIDFFYLSIVNFLVAFILGFLMWLFNLWSAGDAKLFSAFAFLLPVNLYRQVYFGFPALAILINTFVPFAIFYILASIFKLKFAPLKNYVKRSFNLTGVLKVVVYVLGILFLVNSTFGMLGIQTNFLINIFLIFVFIEILEKYKNYYLDATFLIFAVLNLIFSYQNLFTLDFIENYVLLIFAYEILGIFFSYLSGFSFTKNVKINNLKPGMILGEALIFGKQIRKGKKPMFISFYGLFSYLRGNVLAKTNFVLTEESIKKIKYLSKKNRLNFKTIKIENSIPFAPLLFIGVILSYALGTSILAIF